MCKIRKRANLRQGIEGTAQKKLGFSPFASFRLLFLLGPAPPPYTGLRVYPPCKGQRVSDILESSSIIGNIQTTGTRHLGAKTPGFKK